MIETFEEEMMVQYADGLFRTYNFQKRQLGKIYWQLEYIRQELNNGGYKSASLDPDKVPQKHKIEGSCLDILALVEKKDALEEVFARINAPIAKMDDYLEEVDQTTATMLRLYYINGKSYSEIGSCVGSNWQSVRRHIRKALLSYAQKEKVGDEYF